MKELIRVANTKDIASQSFELIEVRGKKIIVYNIDGAYYATTTMCVHQGGPLEKGTLKGTTITCPWHAWQFNVCTGKAVLDNEVSIECYPVSIEGDQILVRI